MYVYIYNINIYIYIYVCVCVYISLYIYIYYRCSRASSRYAESSPRQGKCLDKDVDKDR